MARVLAQSINVPGLTHSQIKGLGKSKRSPKMICSLQTNGLRMMSGFSGLRSTFNPLDTVLMRPGLDFHSKESTATCSWRARAIRCMSEDTFVANFAEKATKMIMLAQEEAKRHGDEFVAREHILLGLVGEGNGIEAKVFKSMGISTDLEDSRVQVEKKFGRGNLAIEVPFTDRSKRVFELSLEEARK